jgi:hypothetical protein
LSVPERTGHSPQHRAMNITALFIRRPVMTTLVMVCLVVFGVLY